MAKLTEKKLKKRMEKQLARQADAGVDAWNAARKGNRWKKKRWEVS